MATSEGRTDLARRILWVKFFGYRPEPRVHASGTTKQDRLEAKTNRKGGEDG